MKTVRWAHAALLAVVLPACAHGGSNENENPNTTSTKAVQQQPADTEWVLASAPTQGGEAKTTFRQRMHPVFLAASTSALNTYYAEREKVEVDAPTCSPWAERVEARCSFSDIITFNTLR